MIANSLRARLIGFAAIAIAIALWAAWHVIGTLFEHYTEQRMATTLMHEGWALVAATQIASGGVPVVDPSDLPGRFRRRGGGLYWEIWAPGGTARSASLGGKPLTPSEALAAPPTTSWRKSEIPGPYETDLIMVDRSVRIGQLDTVVRVGETDEPLDLARASFKHEMGFFLGALGLALALAAWVQVELGLRPLRRVRRELMAMQRNPERRLSAAHPWEIDSLVAAINALADARGEDLNRARRRAADLAHALKTPLAALAAQSRRARAAGAGEAADAIDQTLATAAAALETELVRARAAASRTCGTAPTRPGVAIEQLFRVLERTERGMTLVFDSNVPADWTLGVDSGAFAEIFGNLLSNAVRHAHRIVRVTAAIDAKGVRFEAHDDGPGIPECLRVTVLGRGVRLDEAGPGHGLGLAIVADLVEATNGSIELGVSPEGGLVVMIRWPISTLTTSKLPDTVPETFRLRVRPFRGDAGI